MNTTTLDTAALQARLSERGQGHVLNFWNDLDQSGQDNLLREVSSQKVSACFLTEFNFLAQSVQTALFTD